MIPPRAPSAESSARPRLKRRGARATLLVLDSLGIGGARDAAEYGDEGAATFQHVLEACAPRLPVLDSLGLKIIAGLAPDVATNPKARFGRLHPQSAGKDSTTGHWELAGLVTDLPFRVYPAGFPDGVASELRAATGTGFLGNVAASGTEIIRRLGREHISTRCPILYTSADPVMQIAAHEDVLGLDALYSLCRVAFPIAIRHGLSRVIARPFAGEWPDFYRTAGRRDFTIQPPGKTIIDVLDCCGVTTVGIGKVGELFGYRSFTFVEKTGGNQEGMAAIELEIARDRAALIFANLNDFDTLYGHRRDVNGYARALEEIDGFVGRILACMRADDLLLITADHGNDPTFRGTDHTRECVPVLLIGDRLAGFQDLGLRESFCDVAVTLGEWFGVDFDGVATSLLEAEPGSSERSPA
jgi:phosphopentomutase